MRQAISPRLAMSSLPNTLLFYPGGRAFFEERRNSLAPFGRDARIGDAFGGGGQQHVVERRFDHVREQPLGGRERGRAGREQRVADRLDRRIERGGVRELVHEAELAGA